LTDRFGGKHAIANYGLLCMVPAVGSVLGGPVAAALHDATQSWVPVFVLIITMDSLSTLLALALLRPMRRRFVTRSLG
jgi:MFS transporter, OFA family, oxalate/formate antiporter